jgi:hypothetical protein
MNNDLENRMSNKIAQLEGLMTGMPKGEVPKSGNIEMDQL